jgi:hypothetical protein
MKGERLGKVVGGVTVMMLMMFHDRRWIHIHGPMLTG